MSEARIDLENESSGEIAEEHAGDTPGDEHDRLATTKLPSVGLTGRAPLPPARMPSVPPPPVRPSSTTPPPPPAAARPSWWRSLLATTIPPPPEGGVELGRSTLVPGAEPADVVRRRVAGAAAAAGALAVVLALVIGLRGAPPYLAPVPSIAVSVVIARSLLAVALMGVGALLIRTAERLFLSK